MINYIQCCNHSLNGFWQCGIQILELGALTAPGENLLQEKFPKAAAHTGRVLVAVLLYKPVYAFFFSNTQFWVSGMWLLPLRLLWKFSCAGRWWGSQECFVELRSLRQEVTTKLQNWAMHNRSHGIAPS